MFDFPPLSIAQGPHGPLCTDISTYGPWNKTCEPIKCCEQEKKKNCTDREETKEVTITEIRCEVSIYLINQS